MINIYLYEKTINLLNGNYTNLDDTTMYNDSITIYKGVNNTISFKIRNRDRVQQTPSDVLLHIKRADNSLLVSQMYLELVEDGKFFKVIIKPSDIEQLDSNVVYNFFLTFVDSDGIKPLYTDHDFNSFGELIVRDLAREPSITDIDFTELYDKDGDPVLNTFVSKQHIFVDEFTVKIELSDETLTTTKIFIDKHRKNFIHYETDVSKYWTEYMTIVPEDTVTHLDLPKGHYRFRIESSSKYGKKISRFHIDL